MVAEVERADKTSQLPFFCYLLFGGYAKSQMNSRPELADRERGRTGVDDTDDED